MKKAYFLLLSLVFSNAVAGAAVGPDLDRFLESIRTLPIETQDTMVMQLVDAHKDNLSASEFLRLATGRTYDNAATIFTLAASRFDDPASFGILLDGAFNILWSKQALLVEEAAAAALLARPSMKNLKFSSCFQIAEKFHYLSEIQKMMIFCGSQSHVVDADLFRLIEHSRKTFNGWTTEWMQEPIEQLLGDYVSRNLSTLTLARCTDLAASARYDSAKEKILLQCQSLVGRKAQPIVAADPAPTVAKEPAPAAIEIPKPVKKKAKKKKIVKK